MSTATPLHSIPIPIRPSSPWISKISGLLFFFVFNLGCLIVNGTQFFVLPLRLLPFAWSRNLYKRGIRMTKGWFSSLIVFVIQWFAPSSFRITFETQGKGAFTAEQIQAFVRRNPSTNEAIGLNLPPRFVFISNHQVYPDWLYAWAFIHLGGMGSHVYITLKASLKWVPVVGWGMQFFNFIFLARSWASDKLHLASHLKRLGKEGGPLAFILYPEGTLVSVLTRPLSRKFAEKQGIDDLHNVLLPRSTGLNYCLRSLSPQIPDLQLLDLTILYPGIPEAGYGQTYYTLRSVFFDRVPPPVIHIHLRMFKVADIPIGNPSPGHEVIDVPEVERAAFDLWLRSLWTEKDDSISQFHKEGSFGEKQEAVQIPVQLRRS